MRGSAISITLINGQYCQKQSPCLFFIFRREVSSMHHFVRPSVRESVIWLFSISHFARATNHTNKHIQTFLIVPKIKE